MADDARPADERPADERPAEGRTADAPAPEPVPEPAQESAPESAPAPAQTSEPEPVPAPDFAARLRRMPSWQRNALALVLFAVLLWLVSWAGGRAADRRELAARRAGVDSLATTLAANFVPGDAGRARRTVDALARTGRYSRIILLDAGGRVAASTDNLVDPSAYGDPAAWPAEVRAERRAGRWTFHRAVQAPDAARQGLLVVEIADE